MPLCPSGCEDENPLDIAENPGCQIGRGISSIDAHGCGPPADTNWASPWHEILNWWNNKVKVLSDHAGLKPWSVTCVEAVWKFASYVATLPSERWTCRILEWNIRGPRKRGRPAYTWGQRCKDIPSRKAVAIGLWRLLRMIIGSGRYRILCFSRCTLVDRVRSCISFACPVKGLPSGWQALTLILTLTLTLAILR